MAEKDIFSRMLEYMQEPPVDVEAVAASLGIPVNYAILDKEISGQIQSEPGGQYRIVVNEADSRSRQRFTIAHELGHYLYHRSLIGDGVDDDRAYRSTAAGKYHNTKIGRRHETEANRFAANLLMPNHLIRALKSSGVRSDEDLARSLGVSVPAMRVRLGKTPYPEVEEVMLDDPEDPLLPELDEPKF